MRFAIALLALVLMACGEDGPGRRAEPSQIADRVAQVLAAQPGGGD